MTITKRKKIIIAVVAAMAILLIGALAAGLFNKDTVDEPAQKYHSQLTGAEVEKEISERPVLAVIFNNSDEARPQTGIDAAGIVFETTTEGGITRYLAFYQEDMPDDVGPIRSLRPYFLDWAMGFDSSFAHVGGSAPALEASDERDAKSLNQFQYDEPYYRTNDRPSPHNMYVRTKDLRELQEELGHERSQFKKIPRSNDSPSEDPAAKSITIDYSGPDYKAEFRYDTSSNSYIRYLAGEEHIDKATNKPITVKNLIVIKGASDNKSKAIGSGNALVFKDGDVYEASWEKSKFDERIVVTDEEGNEVRLNRGDTWFAIPPRDARVTY